jgi:hypothetical protein
VQNPIFLDQLISSIKSAKFPWLNGITNQISINF